MKLFQQLLVAPAALGLLAAGANAAELNINTSGIEPAFSPALFLPSAAASAGHHQMPGGINLKPAFIPQLPQHAGHGHRVVLRALAIS